VPIKGLLGTEVPYDGRMLMVSRVDMGAQILTLDIVGDKTFAEVLGIEVGAAPLPNQR